MLALGLVFLVIGIVLVILAAAPSADVPPVLGTIGWLLVVIGLVLVVLAFVVGSDIDVDTSWLGGGAVAMAVGAGGRRFHAAGGDEPAASTRDREPVIVGFILGAIPILSAFVLQVLEATDVLDSALWLRTLLVGLGSVTTALGALWARTNVTPTANPKLDDETPLVPAIEGEGV
jgi:hypothetical protein